MDYTSGTVFDRIGHAAADIGWYCMTFERQSEQDPTTVKSHSITACKEAREYLRSLLFEAASNDRRASWFKQVEERIDGLNVMRIAHGHLPAESMEVMLRELTVLDLSQSHLSWEKLQKICGELGSISHFIQNRIYEEMAAAMKPYKALLK